MTPGPRELLGLVCDDLDAAGIVYALIGASALVAHGFVRATDGLDLLVLDEDILRRRRWRGLEDQGVHVDVRRGDDDDPLLGVIRLGVDLATDVLLDETTPAIVDLVMVRGAWAREILERAATAELTLNVGGRAVPCVSAADLVLLKLYGGGTKDRRAFDGVDFVVHAAAPKSVPAAESSWRYVDSRRRRFGGQSN